MTTEAQRRIRLTVYDLVEEHCRLPGGGVHFVYVRSGSARATAEGRTIVLNADEGAFVTGDIHIEGVSEVWLFETAAIDAPLAGAEIVASHVAELPFEGPFLVRADRIESRHGAQTPKHGHRGPGLRRLLFGKLRADLGESICRITAGAAWFETGREPVVGTNYGGENAAFVRLMVLPTALAGGKSSFVAWNAAEATKARSVEQRLFGEFVSGRHLC